MGVKCVKTNNFRKNYLFLEIAEDILNMPGKRNLGEAKVPTEPAPKKKKN